MLLNRAAATGQAFTTAAVLVTAQSPTELGFIRGPFTIALGGAYIAAAIAAFVRPHHATAETVCAATAVTWWALRGLSLATDGVWAGCATDLLVALLAFLFYWRSLARAGFLQRLDRFESEARG